MKLFIRKGWSIKEVIENQAFTGYCSNTRSYRVSYKLEDGTDAEVVGTLLDVVTHTQINENDPEPFDEVVGYAFTFAPLWYASGPVNRELTLELENITAMSQVYIKSSTTYKPSSKRSKGSTDNSFVFYINEKTSVTVTPNDFVKVCYRSPKREDLKQNRGGELERLDLYGFIVDANEDTTTVNYVENVGGNFQFSTRVIRTHSIYALFHAQCEITTFAPRPKRAKTKAVKNATTQANPEPDLEGKGPAIPESTQRVVTETPPEQPEVDSETVE